MSLLGSMLLPICYVPPATLVTPHIPRGPPSVSEPSGLLLRLGHRVSVSLSVNTCKFPEVLLYFSLVPELSGGESKLQCKLTLPTSLFHLLLCPPHRVPTPAPSSLYMKKEWKPGNDSPVQPQQVDLQICTSFLNS